MSGFNEANTIEEAIRDRLAALPDDNWTFIHGADLPREAQDAGSGKALSSPSLSSSHASSEKSLMPEQFKMMTIQSQNMKCIAI